jgi:YjbE family integral membrane protein
MSNSVDLALEILEIVWINILLSGDNAVLIALACRGLPQKSRHLGVLLGSLFGVLLRVGFTFVVCQLLGVPLLKILGALMLIAIAIKLPNQKIDHSQIEAKPDLVSAVTAIVVADAVMSLDNVVAIAAAAHGSLHLIVFGLALSAPIVMFGAGALMKIFDRLPILIFLGAGLLGFAAGELAAGDAFLARFGAPPPHLDVLAGAAVCVLVLALATLWKVTAKGAAAGRRALLPEAGASNQPQGPLSRRLTED